MNKMVLFVSHTWIVSEVLMKELWKNNLSCACVSKQSLVVIETRAFAEGILFSKLDSMSNDSKPLLWPCHQLDPSSNSLGKQLLLVRVWSRLPRWSNTGSCIFHSVPWLATRILWNPHVASFPNASCAITTALSSPAAFLFLLKI